MISVLDRGELGEDGCYGGVWGRRGSAWAGFIVVGGGVVGVA